ncbi:MAG: MBG domain-containing protein [Georgfuchsia sp.]
MARKTTYLRTSNCLLATAVSTCFAVSAHALPTDPTVVNGSASFAQAGNVLNVTNSNGAVINWNTFSIGASETTRFIQASSSSSVLNRVLADPSVILGTLTSNGRVFLINPSGIYVGQGARIDVAGFVASALNITDANFLANKLTFDASPNAGSVVNQGSITTPGGGSVYLVAPNVSNEGIITTPQGETILAAGQSVTLLDTATPGVSVEITGAEGNATNLGTVVAEAGRIGIAGVLVKNSGTLNASSVVNEGGRIFLKATQNLQIEGSSRIEARSTSANGGFVETSGANVKIADGARVDTSAPNGATGTWLIDPPDFTIAASGGDMTGAELAANLDSTSVVIQSATGTVNTGGNGDIFINEAIAKTGLIDTALTLQAERNIAVNAPISSSSSKLDVTLQAHALDNSVPGSVSIFNNISTNGGDLIVGGGLDPSLTPAIGSYDGSNYLDGVYIQGAQIYAGGGNITINGQGSSDSVSEGGRGVYISSNAIVSTAGTGTVSITGKGASGYSAVEIEGTWTAVSTEAGELLLDGSGNGINGGHGVHIFNGANLQTTSSLLNIKGKGGAGYFGGVVIDGYSTTVTTGNGGQIHIEGAGAYSGGGSYEFGVVVGNGTSLAATGTGSIELIGHGTGDYASFGVALGGSTLQAEDGSISITGHGGAGTGDNNAGILIGQTSVEATGNGDITFLGYGAGTGGNYNSGIETWGGSNLIRTNRGDISITGYGSTAATGYANIGVRLGAYDGSATIESTKGGNVTISGTGGGGNNGYYGYNHGVVIQGASQIRTYLSGNISITGAGGIAEGYNNVGVKIEGMYGTDANGNRGVLRPVVEAMGTGDLTIFGTGGTGIGDFTGNNHGVELVGASIRARDGLLSITGTGGQGSYGYNAGIILSSQWDCGDCNSSPEIYYSVVESIGTGGIEISGTGGSSGIGGYGNDGVVIDQYSVVRSAGGAVAIDGTSNGYVNVEGTANDNPAVLVDGSVMANSSHGAGAVTITGTTSSGGYGISIGSYGAIVAGNRDVTLEATASGGVDIEGDYNTAGSVEAANLTVSGPLTLSSYGYDPIFKVRGQATFDDITGAYGTSVNIVAGSITAGNVTTISGGGYYDVSGGISLMANAGSVVIGNLTTSMINPGPNVYYYGYTSGSVRLKALDSVTTGIIDTSVVTDTGTNSSSAGEVFVVAQRGAVSTGNVTTNVISTVTSVQTGNGGDVYMHAGSGIGTGSVISSSEASGVASTGNGGNVILYANNGDVTTSAIDTSTRILGVSSGNWSGHAGGAILRASGNVLVGGDISTVSANPDTGYSGSGGEVSLYALGGALTVSGTVDASSASSNGGPVTLFSIGDTSVGGTTLTAASDPSGLVTSDGGTPGQATIIGNGDGYAGYAPNNDYIVKTTSGDISGVPLLSEARNVILSAGGGIDITNAIDWFDAGTWVSMRAADGNITIGADVSARGGDILLRAMGSGTSGQIQGSGYLNADGDNYSFVNGGNVRLVADRDIDYAGNIYASGYKYNYNNRADGGNVLIQSRYGFINLTGSYIEASGSYGSNGGNIEITLGNASDGMGANILDTTGSSGSITLGGAGYGNGLDISANGYAGDYYDGIDGGRGGNVRISTALASTGGDITHYGYISVDGGHGSAGGYYGIAGGRGGDSGSVVVEAGPGNGIDQSGSITLGSIYGYGGDGGYAYNNYNYKFPYTDRGGDGGRGGNVLVSGPGAISVQDIYIDGGHSGTGKSNGNGGDGGVVTLTSTGSDVTVTGGISAWGGSFQCGEGCYGWGGDGGKGGMVTINAGRNVDVALDIDVSGGEGAYGGDWLRWYGEPTRGGDGGAGGTINITAQTDANIAGLLYAYGGYGGYGLLDGNYSSYITPGGDGGKGGNVTLNATDGTLTLGYVNADGGYGAAGRPGGSGGDGGSVSLTSGGLLTANNSIDAYGGSGGYDYHGYGQGGDGGKGGTIDIRSTAGSVVINAPIAAAGGYGGWGGNNDFDLTAPFHAGGRGGDGGTVTIEAQGAVTLSDPDFSLSEPIYADGGNGGDGFWDYNRYGYASPGGNGGRGGTVSIFAHTGLVQASDIKASGGYGGSGLQNGNGGDGGNITLVGGGGIALGWQNTGYGASYAYLDANGGRASWNVDGIGGHGGDGGAITLVARDGNIDVTGYLSARGGDSGYGSAPATYGGDGGTVEISLGGWSDDPSAYMTTDTHTITINGDIDVTGGDGYSSYFDSTIPAASGGDGGTVTVTTEYASLGGALVINGNISADAGSGGSSGDYCNEGCYAIVAGGTGGTGGNVMLRATGSVADVDISTGYIYISGGWGGWGYDSPNGLGGNGGMLTVQSTGNVSLGDIYGYGGGYGGSGGTILIESASGSISAGYIAVDAGGGGYSTAPPDVIIGNGLEGGRGGDVTLRVAEPGAVSSIAVGLISAEGAYGGYTADSAASGGAGGAGGNALIEFGTPDSPGSYGGAVSLGHGYLGGGWGGYNSLELGEGARGTSGNVTAIAYGGDLTLEAVTVEGGTLSAESAGLLTLAGDVSSDATGDAVMLVGNSFDNTSGSSITTNNGRWLVWSGDPASDTVGGLVYDFKQYNATYDATSVAGTGNGLLYTLAPTLSVSLSATGVNKLYDGTDSAPATFTPTFTVSGFAGGDNASIISYSAAVYNDSHVAAANTITVSGFTLGTISDGTGAVIYGYPTLTSADIAGSITPVTLTASLTNTGVTKTYDGLTTASFTPTYNVSGLIGGDTAASFDTTSMDYNSAHVATANYVSVGGLSISGITGSNSSLPTDYDLSGVTTLDSVTDSASITPAALGITASDASKTYGQNLTFAGSEFTASGLQNGETISGVTLVSAGAAASAHRAAGDLGTGQFSIAASNAAGIDTTDYAISYNNGTLTVGTAALGITASDASKTYGQNLTFAGSEFTASGLQNSEAISGVTLVSAGAAASAHRAAGDLGTGQFSIAASNAAGIDTTDYAITYNDGTLTVGTAPLTSTATIGGTTTKVYDGTTAATGATLSGSVTGAVNGDTLALNTSGITLNYNNPHVASANSIGAMGSTGFTIDSSTAGSQTTDYSFTGPTISPVAGSITPKGLTAAATIGGTTTKMYDGTVAATGATVSGTVNGAIGGDVLALTTSGLTLSYNSAHVVGATSIDATGSTGFTIDSSTAGSQTTDYSFIGPTISSVTAGITVAPLTITANDASKTYGQTATFAGTAFTSSGLQNSETIGSVAETSTGAAATAHVLGSPYAIVASSATGASFTATDYAISYVDGNLTVNAAPLVSTATIGGTTTKLYDGTTAATGATLSGSMTGAVNGDTLALNTSGITLNYNNPHVASANSIGATGTAGFTISSSAGSLASDYSFTGPTISPVAASITPAVLTVNGNWSTPASWIGSLLPQNTDLLGVLIPGSTNVTFDGVGGPTSVPYLTSEGKLSMTGGALTVGGAFTTVDYSQTGGALTAASVDINSAGIISQTGGSLTTPTLTAVSAGGTTLSGANAIGSIQAGNSGSGDITLTNTGAMSIVGISNSGGNINISNAGPIALDESQVYTSAGTVTLAVLNASSLTLDNGSLIEGNQGVFIGASGVSLNHVSTIQTGPVTTANVEMVISEGDITLDNGSSIVAGNDAIFTLTGPSAQVVLNSAPGEAPSFIKTEYTAETTHINFLSRNSGGIVINGTPSKTTVNGSSGFYAMGAPAAIGNGIEIAYPDGNSNDNTNDNSNDVAAQVIDQYFAQITETTFTSDAMDASSDEDGQKKHGDDKGNNEGNNNETHDDKVGQCS